MNIDMNQEKIIELSKNITEYDSSNLNELGPFAYVDREHKKVP